MRPRKRERVIKDEPKHQFEQIQADHELFLQAFEKPTQIYRYLRTRNIISPIFLHRNLSYVSYFRKQKSVSRYNFKVDSILEKVEAKRKKESDVDSYKSEYMNISFTGFFDKENHELDEVEVETSLLKICHKKRKDVSSPVMQISLGTVCVPCNPELRPSQRMVPAISVASHNFNHNNGHSVKSYVLLLRVVYNVPCPSIVLCNGDLSDSEEPPQKRLRSNTPLTRQMNGVADGESIVYGAELVVYDRQQRCQLTDGDYELALARQIVNSMPSCPKQASWETVMDGKAVGPFEVFNKCPTLKFNLSWSCEAVSDSVLPPIPIPPATEFLNNNQYNTIISERLEQTPKKESPADKKCRDQMVVHSKKKRIFYQFLYNNNTRQQTEARDDLHCPWCSLICTHLYSLLKHLRCCHSRFNFTYVEHPKGARIDVSINECYDGSYVGNPQDLHSHIGYAFSRNGPVRRTPVTQVITYRPLKPSMDLVEFTEPEVTSNHGNRQFIQGHNRLYYHSVTVQPIRPCEIDIDSESENDPIWLRQKTVNMIDEFTDVNEGEKEVMKMWNLHVMHRNYIGDYQLPDACTTFIEEYGRTIIEKNLCRNLILHLSNLHDFSLIKSEVMEKTLSQLQELRDSMKVQKEET